jgi:formate-dependent nitrite reductase cytochrome c552 subunit
MIGQTISHYKILEKLGEGGMGVVYKAEDMKLDRTVALKFLPHHLTANAAEQARFLQEAKAAAQINHPNVCSIIDIQEFKGEQYIVMEYIDGETMRAKIREKGLKIEEITAYYDEIGFRDWTHKDTGAPALKAQHPEFETWNQGPHARAGVTCADCHMPYKRDGAVKVSDHHVRSPLLNINRACQTCHRYSEREILDRAESIQDRTKALLAKAEVAVIDLIDTIVASQVRGVDPKSLEAARKLQRRGQFRRGFANAVGIARAPAVIDPHVAAVGPAQLRQPLQKRRGLGPRIPIIRCQYLEHADAPDAVALLCSCGERPRRRATEPRDERPTFH